MPLGRASCGRGKGRNSLVFLFLCSFVALISGLRGFAQEDLPKGSIEGTIIDAAGAPVAGAAGGA